MPSTTRYRRGDIVLVSFPFTDLTSSKRRPALVVSPDSFNQAMQDVVLAAITSQGVEDSALTIDPTDCVDGILPKKSIIKPAKLLVP
jgi:mRNA interferase MazF